MTYKSDIIPYYPTSESIREYFNKRNIECTIIPNVALPSGLNFAFGVVKDHVSNDVIVDAYKNNVWAMFTVPDVQMSGLYKDLYDTVYPPFASDETIEVTLPPRDMFDHNLKNYDFSNITGKKLRHIYNGIFCSKRVREYSESGMTPKNSDREFTVTVAGIVMTTFNPKKDSEVGGNLNPHCNLTGVDVVHNGQRVPNNTEWISQYCLRDTPSIYIDITDDLFTDQTDAKAYKKKIHRALLGITIEILNLMMCGNKFSSTRCCPPVALTASDRNIDMTDMDTKFPEYREMLTWNIDTLLFPYNSWKSDFRTLCKLLAGLMIRTRVAGIYFNKINPTLIQPDEDLKRELKWMPFSNNHHAIELTIIYDETSLNYDTLPVDYINMSLDDSESAHNQGQYTYYGVTNVLYKSQPKLMMDYFMSIIYRKNGVDVSKFDHRECYATDQDIKECVNPDYLRDPNSAINSLSPLMKYIRYKYWNSKEDIDSGMAEILFMTVGFGVLFSGLYRRHIELVKNYLKKVGKNNIVRRSASPTRLFGSSSATLPKVKSHYSPRIGHDGKRYVEVKSSISNVINRDSPSTVSGNLSPIVSRPGFGLKK